MSDSEDTVKAETAAAQINDVDARLNALALIKEFRMDIFPSYFNTGAKKTDPVTVEEILQAAEKVKNYLQTGEISGAAS